MLGEVVSASQCIEATNLREYLQNDEYARKAKKNGAAGRTMEDKSEGSRKQMVGWHCLAPMIPNPNQPRVIIAHNRSNCSIVTMKQGELFRVHVILQPHVPAPSEP